MNRGRQSLVILILLVALASCKTQRQVIKEPIKDEGGAYLIDQLKNHETIFDDLTTRFSATLIEDKKNRTSFSGQLRIKRDSLIWVSISPALGLEAMRVKISQDSIFLLNRINRTYFKADFAFVNGFINAALDYDMLQAFLTGNDFAFYEIGEFRASIDGMNYRLNTSNRNKIKKYIRQHQEITTIPLQSIWLDPETFKILQVMIKELEVEGRKLTAAYSDFEMVNEQLFPTKVAVEVNADNNIDLNLQYHRVEVNAKKSYPFNIPSSYSAMQ